MSDTNETAPPPIRDEDRTASGAPRSGWAVGDRFSWEEIHQRLLAGADEEIAAGTRELFFSGVTAGIAIVLTLIGFAVGRAAFPDNMFGAALLYPIGFLYIIVGRFQLYTENTLPPVELVLTRLASLPLLLRLWGVVLVANVAGAALGTLVLAAADVLPVDARMAVGESVDHGVSLGAWNVFSRALFAGWLVAGVVWISAAARDSISRLAIVYFVFYVIAVCDLFHVVTTASEVSYAILAGATEFTPIRLVSEFWLPVLVGNTVGGVLVFTLIAYAQTQQRTFPEIRVLSVRDVFLSMKGGRPFGAPRPRPEYPEGVEAADQREDRRE